MATTSTSTSTTTTTFTTTTTGLGSGGGPLVTSGGSGTWGGVWYDELDALDDEFGDAASLGDWSLRHIVENTPPQYDVLDIDASTLGELTIVPRTSGWYDAYEGVFMYKMVGGDFMVEVSVSAANIDDPNQPPTERYNAAGLLFRDPIHGAGQDNWVGHNIGWQNGVLGTEGKTTVDSNSLLNVIPAPTHRGLLRMCRFSGSVILTRRLEGDPDFVQTHEFSRPDLPDLLQVGITVNGWNSGGSDPDFTQSPDIRATFDYIHFSTIFAASDCLAE